MMADLIIRRSDGTNLKVEANDRGGFNVAVRSSRPLVQAEYDKIAAFVGTSDEATTLLTSLRKQMGKA